MFATHNAQTIAAIHQMARGQRDFEFQRLHGMGDDLYAEVIGKDHLNVPCRVYAPVGSHEDLLPYLVRRLLENGANSSFVNRITDETLPPADLVADPVATVAAFDRQAASAYPAADRHLSAADRKNSMGVNLANDRRTARACRHDQRRRSSRWQAAPLVPGSNGAGASFAVTNPADRREVDRPAGRPPTRAQVEQALDNAAAALRRLGPHCRPPRAPRSSNMPPT